ncbi:MAG: hypothetical protein AB7E47_04430 [Desulfovibrionaceae bacterium]
MEFIATLRELTNSGRNAPIFCILSEPDEEGFVEGLEVTRDNPHAGRTLELDAALLGRKAWIVLDRRYPLHESDLAKPRVTLAEPVRGELYRNLLLGDVRRYATAVGADVEALATKVAALLDGGK